jgi:hypothetical protein
MDDLLVLARITVGRNFSRNEWQLYFPGEKYRKTFPDLPEGGAATLFANFLPLRAQAVSKPFTLGYSVG